MLALLTKGNGIEQKQEQPGRQNNHDTSGQGEFRKDYREHAILQKGFNAVLIEDTVQFVLRTMPYALKKPIRILDLCCGNGDFTVALEESLSQHEIQIEQIVGYDISQAQIATANHYHNTPNAKVRCYVQDAARLEDATQFDLVVSYFGLHWLPDSHNLMPRIARALKPQGKRVFFVSLEKGRFLAYEAFCVKANLKPTSARFNSSPSKKWPPNTLMLYTVFFRSKTPRGLLVR